MNDIIEIRNLKKVYDGKTVLKSVSFSVKKGSIHGFIGPNGAGKTTVIKSLMGGIKPNAGDIYVAGKKIEENEFINQKIGFMTEKVEFSNNLTVEEFILLAGVARKIPYHKVEERLRRSDLNNHRHKKCKELSTG
jgi:ABC-type multidrug transport system ATPase subunit